MDGMRFRSLCANVYRLSVGQLRELRRKVGELGARGEVSARVDGAGPIRFFLTILLPLSRTNIAALSVILFIYGWNQYLWPLLITTDPEMTTVVMGIQRMLFVADSIPEWNLTMAAAILAMLPPAVVVMVMQRQFVKGLVETEK